MTQEVNFDVYLYKFDLDFPTILVNKGISQEEYQNTINTLNRILTKNKKINSVLSILFMILFLLFIVFEILMIILGIILFFVSGKTGSILLCNFSNLISRDFYRLLVVFMCMCSLFYTIDSIY
jgi:uncharacterized membrane protein